MSPHEIRPSVSPRSSAGIVALTGVEDAIPSTGRVDVPPAVEPPVAGQSGTNAVDADRSFPVAESPV